MVYDLMLIMLYLLYISEIWCQL